MKTNQDKQTELLDKKELARQLRVSVPLINKWVQQKKVPFLKIGTLVRFRLGEVMAHLEATAKQEPTSE